MFIDINLEYTEKRNFFHYIPFLLSIFCFFSFSKFVCTLLNDFTPLYIQE